MVKKLTISIVAALFLPLLVTQIVLANTQATSHAPITGPITGPLTPTPTPSLDYDNDGYTNSVEVYIGTNPFKACGYEAWAPDFNSDKIVNINDYSIFVAWYRSGTYNKRYDLNADGRIDILDFSLFRASYGKTCN